VKDLRRVHLYLGSFFAPMLLFFALSGVWQEFGLQRYGSWIKYLSAIHTGARLKSSMHSPSSIFLQGFVVLMGLSLIATIILGLVLAFKYGRGPVTLGCLAAGILLPVAIILIFGQ
jgi:hypothetical protein